MPEQNTSSLKSTTALTPGGFNGWLMQTLVHGEKKNEDVVAGVVKKKGDARWEQIKAGERAARGDTGVLDDVPVALPALMRATRLGKRAAAVGFDWPDAAGARAKVLEELAEIEAAQAGEGPERVAEEVGDLLLAATSLSRQLGVDAETALRRANQRFESRFRHMERLAAERGLKLEALTAAQWDALWEEGKRAIQS